MDIGGVFLATAITAFLGSCIMGFVSKMPLSMAPGLGLNAVFTFSLANGAGQIGYQGAVIAVMLSSIMFCIITASNLREYILKSISLDFRRIIAMGVGFFIAYIGLSDIGFVKTTDGIPSAQLANLKANYLSILMGCFVFGCILFMHFRKVTGGVIIAVLMGLAISLIIGNVSGDQNLQKQFSHWNGWSYAGLDGFKSNISSTYTQFAHSKIWTSPVFWIGSFVILIVNFFDASGTLYAVNHEISELSGQDYVVSRRAFMGDAFGGIANGFIGVSPNVSFIESSAGVAQGGRTGFSSLITSLVFASSILLFPLFELIKVNVTGAVLIYVGILMMHQIKHINWKAPENLFAGFLIILVCIVTYTITNGIAVGFLAFSVVCLVEKRKEKISLLTLVLDVIFLGYFVALAFIQ